MLDERASDLLKLRVLSLAQVRECGVYEGTNVGGKVTVGQRPAWR